MAYEGALEGFQQFQMNQAKMAELGQLAQYRQAQMDQLRAATRLEGIRADAAEAEAIALELHSDAQVHALDGALMTEENRCGCWRIG